MSTHIPASLNGVEAAFGRSFVPDQPGCSGALDEGAFGLTKREYFAAMALQGLMHALATDPTEAARLAVLHADSLLVELED